jgi:hypothetical protein
MVPEKWISGIPRKLNLFGKLMFTSVEFYGIPFANLCGTYIAESREKTITESQSNTVCSSYKRKFVVFPFVGEETNGVVFPFVGEETNGSYPFANELNRLNGHAH